MDELPLDALIEAWLDRPAARLDHRFPPALEAVYAAETASARQRAVWVSSLAGCITAIVLVLPVWRLLSDAHPLVRLVWLEIGLPISIGSHVLVYAPLKVIWQEAQVALAGVLVAICIAIMLTGSAHGGASLLMGSVVLLLLLGLIGSRFPFAISVAYAPALFAVFVGGIAHMPHLDGPSVLVLTVLMAVISFYAAFGNWRLEVETRRSYALMLRARLAQQDLSFRNLVLNDLARHDPLTGLANRRAYDAWLDAGWRQAQAEGAVLSLILLDVDNFKLFNDFYGHPCGDACLRAVADCLQEQLRGTTDYVARVGGEEFAVILPCVTLAHGSAVAARLRSAVAALRMPHGGLGNAGHVTVSLGVASVVPAPADAGATGGPEALVRAADQALYAAKQGGRDCVYLATADASGATRPDPRRLGVGG